MKIRIDISTKEVLELLNKKEPQEGEALVATIKPFKYSDNPKEFYFIKLSDGRCFKCEEYDQDLSDDPANQ